MSRSRRALLALLGLIAFGLFAITPPDVPRQEPPTDPEDGPRSLVLSSDDLPDPVAVQVGGVELSATRFRLVVPVLTRQGGAGTLTLSTGPLAFNDYGDANPVGGSTAVEVPVTLHGWETGFGGTFYEVQLADSKAAGRLWLYLVPEPADEHRLIIWPPGKGRPADPTRWWRGWGGNPERVLALRPPTLPPDPLPDLQGKTRPTLSGLVRNPDPVAGRGEPDPQQVTISGHPATGGELDLDPNYLSIGPHGLVTGSTLVYRPPVRVTFRAVGPDPLGRGREAFELVPADAEGKERYDSISTRLGKRRTYVVVYAAEARGPHRLVVKEGDTVRQVVPLTDFDRVNRLAPIRARLMLPSGERAVVDHLAALCGPKFSFRVASRHVWTVTVSGDAARLDPLLAKLPRLRDLNYEPASLPPAGLPSLGKLRELSSIRIVGHVDDEGLASLVAAPNLTLVQVYASSGLTPRGLRHLAQLPKATILEVGLPDPILDPSASDEALEELAAAPAVEQLNVWNIRPTDAGIAHLRQHSRLRSLNLWHCDRLTPASLHHLSTLPVLHQLTLSRTALPGEAVADFRARRPKVELTLNR